MLPQLFLQLGKVILGSLYPWRDALNLSVHVPFLGTKLAELIARFLLHLLNITLPACGEGMMALPALEVPAVKVSGSNGAYAFAQENYAGTVTVNGAEKNYTVTLQGTLRDNTLTVNYSVQYGKMPMPMIAKFVCTK